MQVGESGDKAVGKGEAPVLAELVEAVLRADARGDAGEGSGQLAVDVCMDEVRVQQRRAPAREVPRQPEEGERIHVGSQANGVQGHVLLAQCTGELEGAGLPLVQHQHPGVPAARSQSRQQGEEIGLGARDPRDLLEVDDRPPHASPAAHRTPSAQLSTV